MLIKFMTVKVKIIKPMSLLNSTMLGLKIKDKSIVIIID